MPAELISRTILDELVADFRDRLVPFPVLAEAIRRLTVARAEIPLLLRNLLDAGVHLPANLEAQAAPTPQTESVDRATAPPAFVELSGDEILDLSGISLADLDLLIVPRPVSERVENVQQENPDTQEPGPDIDLLRQYHKEAGRETLLSQAEEVELAKRFEAGCFAEERLKADLESGASQADLLQLTADGREAFNTFARANLRLVISIARRYTERGLDLLDLIQ